MTWFSRWSRLGLLLVLMLAIVSGGGCRKTLPPNSVSGKVLYNDGPLLFGKVQFYADEQNMVGEALIQHDGSYRIANVPTGPVKICVRAEMPPDPREAMGGMPPMMRDMMRGKMPPGMENMKPPDDGSGKPPPGMENMRPPMRPQPRPAPKPGEGPPPFDPKQGLPTVTPEIQAAMDKVSKKYGDVRTTTLTCDVQSGDQTFDIRLTSP